MKYARWEAEALFCDVSGSSEIRSPSYVSCSSNSMAKVRMKTSVGRGLRSTWLCYILLSQIEVQHSENNMDLEP